MGDFILRGRLGDALSYAFAAQRMVKQGSSAADVAAILQPVDLTAVRAGNSSAVYNELRGAVVVFILMFVMLFSLLSYGVMVMRSVMEEKSSRITEVLMCAASAQELMSREDSRHRQRRSDADRGSGSRWRGSARRAVCICARR